MVKAFDTSLAERTGVSGGVQGFDALLQAFADLVTANNKGLHFTGANAPATHDQTAFGRTLAGLANAAALRTAGGLVIGTDVQAFHAMLAALSVTTAREACAVLGTWHTLAASGVLSEVNNEGLTTEKVLATITVPAGAMGPNGILRIWALWSMTNGANDKILRVRFSGTGGTEYLLRTTTTQAGEQGITMIRNRNSQSSQVGWQATGAGYFNNSTAALVTSGVDTSAGTTVVISAQLETATERATLEAHHVEVLYGA